MGPATGGGRYVLGRLQMEIRHQLSENDSTVVDGAWTGRIHVGGLAGATGRLNAGSALRAPAGFGVRAYPSP